MTGFKEPFRSDALKGKRWFGVEEQERSLSDEEKKKIMEDVAKSAERTAEELKRKYKYDPSHHGGREL